MTALNLLTTFGATRKHTGGGGGDYIVGVTQQYLSASSVTVTFPTDTTVGDQLLVLDFNAGSINGHILDATVPPGWSTVFPPNWGNAGRPSVHHHVYAAGDGTTAGFASYSGLTRIVLCLAVRGATFTTAANAADALFTADTYSAPSVTPAADSLLVFAANVRKNVNTSKTLTVPSGMEEIDYWETANFKTLLAWEEVPSGATGTRTTTHASDTGPGGAWNILLKKK